MQVPLADGLFGLNSVQVAMLIAGVALIYSISRWRRNTVNQAQQKSVPRQDPSIPASALNVREITTEVQALLADIEETARRVTAQIDNRHTRLEQLIAEADEKIRALQSALNSAGIPPSAGESPSAGILAKPERIGLVPEAQRALTRLRQERGAPPADLDPAYQPIYSLADGGKNAREIAQQLGRQPGEIELILALRQRRHA